MPQSTTERAGRLRNWPPAFHGGSLAPLAFLLALAALVVVSNVAVDLLLPADASTIAVRLVVIPSDVLTIALAWSALRYEGVALRDVGLARPLLAPALVAFGALVVALNVAAVGLALLADRPLSLGFVATDSPTLVVVSLVAVYGFAAFAEELAVRGYLQNELVAALDGRHDRLRTLLGVVIASAAFTALHLPRVVLDGGSPLESLPYFALLFATGLGFGVIYELTHNLYLVTLLHGVGNYALLVVDPGTWPNWPVVVVLYALLVLAYRRWAARTTRDTLGVPGRTAGDLDSR